MNNLNPTPDSRIFESSWFVDPKHPLIENKIFYAKVDNLLYYITAHRGPTTDDLEPTSEVKGMELGDSEGIADNSADCFNDLQKFINKKTQ